MHYGVRNFLGSENFAEMTNVVPVLVGTEFYRSLISVASSFLTDFIVIISVFRAPIFCPC